MTAFTAEKDNEPYQFGIQKRSPLQSRNWNYNPKHVRITDQKGSVFGFFFFPQKCIISGVEKLFHPYVLVFRKE